MTVGIIAGNVRSINVVEVSVNLPEIAAATTEENTFTLNGVKVGDYVHVTPQTHTAGVLYGTARVSAENTVALQTSNSTALAVDPGAVTCHVLIVRLEGGEPSSGAIFD